MRQRKQSLAVEVPKPVSLSVVPPLQGVRLPRYSKEDGVCDKCGSDCAKTQYMTSGQNCTHPHGSGVKSFWGQERLHRICRNCGYPWDEAVVGRG